MAYNFGRRARAEGFNIFNLGPLEETTPTPTLTPGEWEALDRLGPDAFHRWAVRGWAEPTAS